MIDDRTGSNLNDPLSLEEAQDRCEEEIESVVRDAWSGTLCALPSMRKTSGVPPVVAETGIPATILTGRGHEEQYDDILENAASEGLAATRIPSSYEDCPTANGDHGDKWKRQIRRYLHRGVSTSAVHEAFEFPCESNCKYREKIAEILAGDFDLLVGHYRHAYFGPAVEDRTVFVDEFFGDSFESKLSREQISHFLASHDALPFDHFDDLLSADDEQIDDTRGFFEEHGLRHSEKELVADGDLWGLVGVGAWGVLTGEKLENGWLRASFTEYEFTGELDDVLKDYWVAYDGSRVFVFNPPDFSLARNVIGLDGTPTMEMWQFLSPCLLEKRQVLSDAERKSYITDALGHEYVHTTCSMKPYAPREKDVDKRITIPHDSALLEGIQFHEGTKPNLITTKRAGGDSSDPQEPTRPYEEHGLHDLVNDYYSHPVLGSNSLRTARVGAVIGYQEYGDDFIQKWGAYAGESVPSGDDAHPNNGERDHGKFGNAVLRHMREHQTLQAAMRFGRDGDGATVYIDTNTLPDWVPIAGEWTVYSLADNDGLRSVVDAARERDWFTVSELADEVDLRRRTVSEWVRGLRFGGYVDSRPKGGSAEYQIHDIEHGIVVPDTEEEAA